MVAFGDAENDIDLLRWSGRGYAVANGRPEVRAAADEVIASNDHDAVAMTLVRLLGL